MKLYDLETYHKRSVQEGWSTPELAKKVLEAYECCSVEAIPVEWLLNHIPHDEQMEAYNRKLIEYLVIAWRKENER